MATKTSLIINMSRDNGTKKFQRAITYVNPNATDTEMKALAQGFTGLTTNTYESSSRVDTTELDITKITPTCGWDNGTSKEKSIEASSIDPYVDTTHVEIFNYNGDASYLEMKLDNRTGVYTICPYEMSGSTPNLYAFDLVKLGESIYIGGKITITIPETERYYGATLTLTILEE